MMTLRSQYFRSAMIGLVTVVVFALSSAADAQVVMGTPLTGSTYSNPVIRTDFPDPTIFQDDDGKFYAISTLEHVYTSTDLVNWKDLGWMWQGAHRPKLVDGIGSVWAPDLNKINGKYVCYFSESVWGGGNTASIGVAVADKPQGPYRVGEDEGKLFSSAEIGVHNSIDPFYIEDDGQKYLFWGSFFGIYGIELSDDGLSIKEGAEKFQIGGKAYEASYIYKRNGYYYYFGSIGSCCEGVNSTYETVVARSKSLKGPYTNKSGKKLLDNGHEVIISRNDTFVGNGHNSEIVTDNNGDTWFCYHGIMRDGSISGRPMFLDRILWINDWPYVPTKSPSVVSAKPAF